MAKKKSKQQLKQPNATNVGDTAAVQTTSQPASTSQDDAHALATTQISFFDFITMATTEDIKVFLKLASTTPEGENLETLWRRAHGEGYEKGRKVVLQDLEKKMEDKFEEGVEKGKDLGREEGYSVAKEAFDEIIKVVKAREAPKIDTSDAETQTGPPCPFPLKTE
jgi:flagellar biosynthesis/type III secretory pathway protein FliH